MKQIGIGLVGYGSIAKVHALSYYNIPMYYQNQPCPVKLVGLYARREESCLEARQQTPVEFTTTNYDDLLSNPEINVIDITLPNHLHREFTMKALAAGKHVYCEKPLAVNLEEALEMVSVAKNMPIITGIPFVYRFIPALIRLKQLIDEGRIGDIYHFRFAFHHSGYENPDRPLSWRLQNKYSGGGALADLGSHLIDLALYFMGDFNKVLGAGKCFIKERPLPERPDEKGMVDVDDYFLLQVELAQGGTGVIESSRFATGSENELILEIHGSKGAVLFNMMNPNYLHFFDATAPKDPIGGFQGFTAIATVQKYPSPGNFPGGKNEIGWIRFHIASQFEYLKAVAEGKAFTPDFEQGLKVQRIIEAAYNSSKLEKWLSI